MADVQLTDGFVRIALPFRQAYRRMKLSGQERQVFDFIQDATWGTQDKRYQDEYVTLKEARLGLDDFVKGTGLVKPRVSEALARLEARNMIRVEHTGHVKTYSIVKDYDQWLDDIPQVHAKSLRNSVKNLTENRKEKAGNLTENRKKSSGIPENKLRNSVKELVEPIDIKELENRESTAHAPEAPAPSSFSPPPVDDFFQDELAAAKAVVAVTKPKKRTLDDVASDLFDYWQETLMHPRAVFSEEERALAVKRLKELVKGYKGRAAKDGRIMPDIEAIEMAEQLCRDAITGIARIPWNVGINKFNKPYDDFELIFRDQAHIRDYAKAKDERPIDIRAVRQMRKAGFSEAGIATGLNMVTAMEQIAQWETDHESR